VRFRVFAFAAVWVVYAWALPLLGFIVATTCVLTVSLWLLRVRSIFVGFLGALSFSVAFSILFATVLFIPTPDGIVDRTLIEAIYAIQH